mmetsp:Transcript_34052/g.90734  ORF Transcript_34052/g.90734 Transcript_34052/m.90734 type:complete len:320 (-) Transcript_34052:120-1079(-)|eukprot:CAMPEP_0194533176 /NCGR_PEP_ID=MMETSP0253-20130528/70993_1 /TAXON_ID=2966 /ORGANISM="Noctiluca scintillans" /LENGTH=319 /DNA_ID=CAMNT_0039378703 /DNA_START=30 /DNA_END=989 /DNA_ORIENTATION=-
MDCDESNHYTVLGVPPSASAEQLRRAYKELATRYHPHTADPKDEADMVKTFERASEAYSILKDPLLRARYDQGVVDNVGSKPSIRQSLLSSSASHDSIGSSVKALSGPSSFVASGLELVANDKEHDLGVMEDAVEHYSQQLESRLATLQQMEETCVADQLERDHKETVARRGVARAWIISAFVCASVIGTICAESLYASDSIAVVWKCLVLVLSLVIAAVFLLIYAGWKTWRLHLLRRAREQLDESDANAVEAMRKTVNRAHDRLDLAQQDLEIATDAWALAQADVAEVQREGASLDQVVKIGMHYVRQLKRAAGSLSQ